MHNEIVDERCTRKSMFFGIVYALVYNNTDSNNLVMLIIVRMILYEEVLELVKQLVFPKIASNLMPGTPWNCHKVLPWLTYHHNCTFLFFFAFISQ